jgi:hypothetical protein
MANTPIISIGNNQRPASVNCKTILYFQLLGSLRSIIPLTIQNIMNCS